MHFSAPCPSKESWCAQWSATNRPSIWHTHSGQRCLLAGFTAGVFKYVLLRLHDGGQQARSKLLVWGDKRAPYHMDIFSQVKAMVRVCGLCASSAPSSLTKEQGKKEACTSK